MNIATAHTGTYALFIDRPYCRLWAASWLSLCRELRHRSVVAWMALQSTPSFSPGVLLKSLVTHFCRSIF
jgi:hypothetical protein